VQVPSLARSERRSDRSGNSVENPEQCFLVRLAELVLQGCGQPVYPLLTQKKAPVVCVALPPRLGLQAVHPAGVQLPRDRRQAQPPAALLTFRVERRSNGGDVADMAGCQQQLAHLEPVGGHLVPVEAHSSAWHEAAKRVG